MRAEDMDMDMGGPAGAGQEGQGAAGGGGAPDLRQVLGTKHEQLGGHFSASAALGFDADALDDEP